MRDDDSDGNDGGGGGGGSVATARAAAIDAGRAAQEAVDRSSSSPSSPSSAVNKTEYITPLHSTQDYLDAMARDASAGKVSIIMFKAPWCRSCKAVYPKYRRMAAEFGTDALSYYEVDFSEQRELCCHLGIKVLPYFQVYSGEAGRVEEFSCGPSRASVLRSAMETYSRAYCDLPQFSHVAYD